MNRLLFAVAAVVFAGLIGTHARSAETSDDIRAHRECVQCGMDRKAYGFSRMLLVFEDGAEIGVCSLHCAVVEMDQNKEKKLKSLLVADRETRAMVEAEKAVWVLGGNKRGVMTARAKWAFAAPEEAGRFIEKHGGKKVSFEEALAAAREDMNKNRKVMGDMGKNKPGASSAPGP